jgi:energy-coupling factor transporter ATP-binding protein EcfA2
MSGRKLRSWLAGFMEFTDGLVSPASMRMWSGLSTIAAALSRRVNTHIQSQELYPNMYVLLVGPPGVGKSNAAIAARGIIQKVQSIRLSPEASSKRALIAELDKAQTNVQINNPLSGLMASLYAQVEEFAVLVHPQDREFMVALARLYDSRDVFEYKTMHVGEHHIEKACLNLLGCCTRGYLKEAWTRDVLEAGLPARMVMVYSEEVIRRELFDATDILEGLGPERELLRDALVHDLEKITHLYGRYGWEEEAKKTLRDWYAAGMPPRPGDSRLIHYCNRRLVHVVKLSMVVAASKGDELVVTLEDFVAAKEILLGAEREMPTALAILGENPLVAQMDLAIKIIRAEYVRMQGKRGVPEYKVRQFLYREVPPQFINSVLDGLVLANEIRSEGEAGSRIFFPKQSRLDEKRDPQDTEEE